MVFGWGKKKPQKQESDIAPQKKQILLSDVPNVANEIRSIRTKTIIADVKTFRNKINSSCETYRNGRGGRNATYQKRGGGSIRFGRPTYW